MNINYIRWLSKHGKIREDRKSVERNYKAVAREVKLYAKQGHRFAIEASSIPTMLKDCRPKVLKCSLKVKDKIGQGGKLHGNGASLC